MKAILKKANGTIIRVALPDKFKGIQNRAVLRNLLDNQIANAIPKGCKAEVLRDVSGQFAAVQYFTSEPAAPAAAAPKKRFTYNFKL